MSYEKQAQFDVIGLRRISAAYRPIPTGGGDVEGWLAFAEEIKDRSTEIGLCR